VPVELTVALTLRVVEEPDPFVLEERHESGTGVVLNTVAAADDLDRRALPCERAAKRERDERGVPMRRNQDRRVRSRG
jgi:hypothetical protein